MVWSVFDVACVVLSEENNKWKDNSTVVVLVSLCLGADFFSCDFYEKTKSSKDFMMKIWCTEKYDWADV